MDDRDVEELHRIWELREKGAISEEEYSRLKAQILGLGDNSGQRRTGQLHEDHPPSETPVAVPNESSEAGNAKAIGIACAVIGIVALIVAAIGSGGNNNPTSNVMTADENLVLSDMNVTDMNAITASDAASGETSGEIGTNGEETGRSNLTASEANAVRSAEQYLSMTGFSRDGLIDQLSSDAGDGYSVADATAAVDSLTVDWHDNAAKSARQYLSMSGFSCEGLIEQLSSRAGDKYTVEQATYGARQAGAC